MSHRSALGRPYQSIGGTTNSSRGKDTKETKIDQSAAKVQQTFSYNLIYIYKQFYGIIPVVYVTERMACIYVFTSNLQTSTLFFFLSFFLFLLLLFLLLILPNRSATKLNEPALLYTLFCIVHLNNHFF